jgi:hypothetical protein
MSGSPRDPHHLALDRLRDPRDLDPATLLEILAETEAYVVDQLNSADLSIEERAYQEDLLQEIQRQQAAVLGTDPPGAWETD